MKEYSKPWIEEEGIELEDVIASSTGKDVTDPDYDADGDY